MMSERMRSSIRVGLAMMIASGLSLSLGWEQNYWSALAVAVISVMPTTGESLLKGLMRLGGHAIAIPVAIVLMSIALQERWTYGILLWIWISFCAWHALNTSYYYIWLVSSWVVPLLTMMSGGESQGAFNIIIMRSEQTILGVLVYTVVSLCLFTTSSRGALMKSAAQGIADLSQRVDDVLARMQGDAEDAEAKKRRAKVAGAFDGLREMFNAARVENFEILERRGAWDRLIGSLSGVATTLDYLDLSFGEGSAPLTESEIDGYRRDMNEIKARILAVGGTATKGAYDRPPEPLSTTEGNGIEPAASPFEEGERLLRRELIGDLDRQTHELRDAAADMADLRILPQRKRGEASESGILPDPYTVALVLRAGVVFWLSFLTIIYVPGLPLSPALLVMAAVMGVMLQRMPQVSAVLILPVALVAIAYGGGIQIFIMPHLSSYIQLGPLIFLGAFIITWICHEPKLALGKLIGLVFFVEVTHIGNNQGYSVIAVLELAALFSVFILIMVITQYFPSSWRAEVVLRRLLRRYTDSMISLLEGLHWEDRGRPSWFARQLRLFHLGQIDVLPSRISAWAKALPKVVASDADRTTLVEFADRLHLLSERVRVLVRVRDTNPDAVWVAALADDMRSWRLGIEAVANRLGRDPGSDEAADLNRRLGEKLATLEMQVAKTVNSSEPRPMAPAGTAHMQRVLSAYRGVSEAAISAVERARQVDWSRLADSRF